jgi:hypothetical protein
VDAAPTKAATLPIAFAPCGKVYVLDVEPLEHNAEKALFVHAAGGPPAVFGITHRPSGHMLAHVPSREFATSLLSHLSTLSWSVGLEVAVSQARRHFVGACAHAVQAGFESLKVEAAQEAAGG